MTTQTIKQLRAKYRIPQNLLAMVSGVGHSTIERADRGQGSPEVTAKIMAAIDKITSVPEPQRWLLAMKGRPSSQCKNDGCGIVLYSSTRDIPDKWVKHWHVDCGGYCPGCAARLGKGDVKKALGVLVRALGMDQYYAIVKVANGREPEILLRGLDVEKMRRDRAALQAQAAPGVVYRVVTVRPVTRPFVEVKQ